jgi:tRNA G46 methylase TrmB
MSFMKRFDDQRGHRHRSIAILVFIALAVIISLLKIQFISLTLQGTRTSTITKNTMFIFVQSFRLQVRVQIPYKYHYSYHGYYQKHNHYRLYNIQQQLQQQQVVKRTRTTKTTFLSIGIRSVSTHNNDDAVTVTLNNSNNNNNTNNAHDIITTKLSTGSNNNNYSTVSTLYSLDHKVSTNYKILYKIVIKHLQSVQLYWQYKPIAAHTQQAFNDIVQQITHYYNNTTTTTTSTTTTIQQSQSQTQYSKINNNNHNHNVLKLPIILDSGCGTGRSSIRLGTIYPNHIIIGIDRSIVRLQKGKNTVFHSTRTTDSPSTSSNIIYTNDFEEIKENDNDDDNNNVQLIERTIPSYSSYSSSSFVQQVSSNVWLVRAELSDFYKCIINHNNNNVNKQVDCTTGINNNYYWDIEQHYILYPNPYPKQSRIQNRLYAHPVFPILVQQLQQQSPSSSLSLSSSFDNQNHIDNQSNNQQGDTTKETTVHRQLIVRSNWKQYLIEFLQANDILTNAIIEGTGNNVVDKIDDDDSKNSNNNSLYYFDPTSKEPQILYQDYYSNTASKTDADISTTVSSIAWTNFEEKYILANETIYQIVFEQKHKK